MGRMLDKNWEERELEEATRRSLDLHTDTQVGYIGQEAEMMNINIILHQVGN